MGILMVYKPTYNWGGPILYITVYLPTKLGDL